MKVRPQREPKTKPTVTAQLLDIALLLIAIVVFAVLLLIGRRLKGT